MKLTTRLSRSAVTLRTRIVAFPVASAVCAFVALYLIAIYYVRSISSRDPGSWFFDPNTAYDHLYTNVRQQQAESYVLAANSAPPFKRNSDATPTPSLCVGIPSIAREGVVYLRTTVGSLVEGLTQDERDGIYLIVFIPHTNPAVHPAFYEPWLVNLADNVLLYDLSQSQLNHIVSLEGDSKLVREKSLFDYTYLLKACYATGAPYIAMLEDDVIAMDDWYHRTLAGSEQAKTKTAQMQSGLELIQDPPDYLYLRLFYTEEFLGWNSEDWQAYAFVSICIIAASGLFLYLARSSSCSPNIKRLFTPRVILAISTVPVPLAILLFFAAGKVTVLPLPAGVNAMNNYGCCSQGLVFPRQKAQVLIEWFEEAHVGFVDMLTEEYADKHGELRWALTPSVIQHIGQISSKSDKNSKHRMSTAQKLWNFAFELNDATKLHIEHAASTQDT